MVDCFACGSERSKGKPVLKVYEGIEYVQYDFSQGKSTVWGDFFVQNCSDRPERLYILHPGNFELKNISTEWFSEGNYQTKLVQHLLLFHRLYKLILPL